VTAGWAWWLRTLLTTGAGLVAGFVAGAASTLALGQLTAHPAAIASLQFVMGLLGASILAGVVVLLGAALSFTWGLHRIATRIDGIADAASIPTVGSSSAFAGQGGWQGQAAGNPQVSSPGQAPALRQGASAAGLPPGTARGGPAASDIGASEPFQPGGSSFSRFGSPADDAPESDDTDHSRPSSRDRAERRDPSSLASGTGDEPRVRISTPASEQLVDVWSTYLDRGDGRFEPKGLQRHIEAADLHGTVVTADGLGEGLLGVDLKDGYVYVLPPFNSTPRAVSACFDARAGASSRQARIQRLWAVAVARRSKNGRLELATKGLVE
jgi:hypothetical protein